MEDNSSMLLQSVQAQGLLLSKTTEPTISMGNAFVLKLGGNPCLP